MQCPILLGLEGQTPVCCLKNTSNLESHINYTFKDQSLLEFALTHKSYYHENQQIANDHNERLEFLGDSVLGLVIAEKLFSHANSLSEAEMSKMKSFLVNENSLLEIAKNINLGFYLKLGKGEEASGGREKKSILADATEALIGAIFLDSDYQTTKKIVLNIYGELIDNVINKKEGYDFKSALQELCQELYNTLPEYVIVKQEGQEHKKIFTISVLINGVVFGTAKGSSKKEAQIFAAKEALLKIQDNQKGL